MKKWLIRKLLGRSGAHTLRRLSMQRHVAAGVARKFKDAARAKTSATFDELEVEQGAALIEDLEEMLDKLESKLRGIF